MGKKLSLETKIRDAALSLSRVNASHKKVSKQTEEQLDAANRRVESAQKEYWRVSDRANEINKKLLEHRAGVLSFSVRNMEKKMFPSHTSEDSGYDSSNRSTLMSPTTSSMTGVSTSSQARFDGAHLFAGHADAVIPQRNLTPGAAATEISSLEEKLKAVTESLTAAGKKQAEMARELSLLQLEKQEVETMMGLELQNAEDTITALEKELPRLEGLDSEVQQLLEEKRAWEEERAQLQELESGKRLAAGAEKMLEEISQQLEEKNAEIQELHVTLEAERKAWDQERTRLEEEKEEDLKKMHSEMDRLREDDEDILYQANQELDVSREALRSMVAHHGIVLFSRDSSLQGLLESIGTHLEGVHKKLETHSRVEAEWELSRRKLEDDIRSGFDKRELLAREVEDARRERDSAKRETASLESRVKVCVILSDGLTKHSLPPRLTWQCCDRLQHWRRLSRQTRRETLMSAWSLLLSCQFGKSFPLQKPARPSLAAMASDRIELAPQHLAHQEVQVGMGSLLPCRTSMFGRSNRCTIVVKRLDHPRLGVARLRWRHLLRGYRLSLRMIVH